MPRLHETPMGHRFFNLTIPSIVNELTKLNQNLSKLIDTIPKSEREELTEHVMELHNLANTDDDGDTFFCKEADFFGKLDEILKILEKK